jgi:hypothetical protein
MANEYLRRTPTSTGNRRVFTWSGWIKKEAQSTNATIFEATLSGEYRRNFLTLYQGTLYYGAENPSPTTIILVGSTALFRDNNSWYHILWSIDTTALQLQDRVRIYVNGVQARLNFTTTTNLSINTQQAINGTGEHNIGRIPAVPGAEQFSGYLADVFFVDGQALTPDVFGFYKQGKGYISVGSTQATDFRPGQWVPKTPRVIKTEIIRRGGFGVNGFYLPMNDSKNFGADFHCDPNSIITLNEKLPQPRVGVATTASVGLGYTDALRADPYAANLVLALPFVSGGLSSGFGDYAPSIKGSGSAKTVTINGSVSIASTAGYYGSSSNFGAAGALNYLQVSASSDFAYGSGNFTIETWWFPTSTTRQAIYHGSWGADYSIGIDYNGASSNLKLGMWASSNGSSWNLLNADAGGNGITAGTPVQNQWNHIAYVRNGSTFSMYLNGVCVGTVTGITAAVDVTASDTQVIGEWWNTSAMNSISGYLQDFRIYKGVAKYTGGFDVPRPYTPVGIATWRAVPDTTANNFATLNPLRLSSNGTTLNGRTLTNGNLTATNTSTNQGSSASISVSSGQWYWEFRLDTFKSDNIWMGILDENFGGGNSTPQPVDSNEWPTNGNDELIMYGSSGSVYRGSVNTTSSLGTIRGGDILGVALDLSTSNTAPTVSFYKNGVLQHTSTGSITTAATPSGVWRPAITFGGGATGWLVSSNFGQNPTFSGNTTAGTFTDSNSKGLFKYQPPSGFLSLCEDNLPTPAISNPGQYFKTVLYTGDGNSGRSIVGVGFTPDLVWIKSRGPSAYNHRAFDSVRGAGKDNFLMPNSTAVEGASSDYYGGISSFNADGFSMVYGTGGSNIGINESGTNFVAWCWRAGNGTTSTNTNGSITSVVSVNQDAGFSIVSYTGNGGSSATVGHGLGRKPAMIIYKSRDDVSTWNVTHKGLGAMASQFLYLHTTNAVFTDTSLSGNTEPTSSIIGVGWPGSGVYTNKSGSKFIAYCWAEIEGFSKFGSYVGNGNADGPFVYCGFKPAFVMVKRTDGGVENWIIFDNVRKSYNDGDQRALFPNLADAEGTGWPIDFLSNGFKNRYTGSSNTNGATYIFAAFAESPFTTANAK